MRLLLAEDDAQRGPSIARGLRERAYSVDLAPDGPTTAFLAAINEYDLIVLDVVLPERSGSDIGHDLRARGVRTPVLMLTARDAVSDRIRGLEAGADDYLVKPFVFDEYARPVRLGRVPSVVVTAQSLHAQAETIEELQLAYLVAIAVALSLSWVGGYVIARRSLLPVTAMSRQAAAISAANLHERLAVANPHDGLGELATVPKALLPHRLAHADTAARHAAHRRDALHGEPHPARVRQRAGRRSRASARPSRALVVRRQRRTGAMTRTRASRSRYRSGGAWVVAKATGRDRFHSSTFSGVNMPATTTFAGSRRPFSSARATARAGGLAMAVTMAALSSLAGCTKSDAVTDRAAPGTSTSQPSSSSGPAATGTVTSTHTPASIELLGRLGEDAFDYASAGQWPKLDAALDSMRLAADELGRTEPAQRESLTAVIQALAAGRTSKRRDVAMRAANETTRLAAQLSASYKPPVPADVALLDYEGRELEIWGRSGNLPRLEAAQRRTRDIWATLRPSVVARGGTHEAARFDTLVARLSTARTAAQYAALAKPILDEVDALERVFTR